MKWDLDLHNNTFLVILSGVLIISIVSFLGKKFGSIIFRKENIVIDFQPKVINVEKIKLYVFILFELFVILYSAYSVVKVVGVGLGEFTKAVVMYRNSSMFGDSIYILPSFLITCRVIVDAAGYWFGYVLVNNYLSSKSLNKKMVLIVLLSAGSNYMLGGRNGLIDIFVGIIVSYFIINNKIKGYKKLLKFSTVIRLLIIALLIFTSFESLAILIGRSGFETATGIDYLAVYIGAPIKNLDTFLQEPRKYVPEFQTQTFINFMNWIGPKIGILTNTYKLDLPFRQVNSSTLGNVYTTFYPYVYDFGYLGVPILISIMSLISQLVYEKVKRVKEKFYPRLATLIYIYLSSSILMSFFSNKFYEKQFNIFL